MEEEWKKVDEKGLKGKGKFREAWLVDPRSLWRVIEEHEYTLVEAIAQRLGK